MARSGWSVQGAAEAAGFPWRRFNDCVPPRLRLWLQMLAIDPIRTQATLVHTMMELTGQPDRNGLTDHRWTPKQFEQELQRSPGTGRQTLDACRLTIARLKLSDVLLTEIDLLETGLQAVSAAPTKV